jgi:hypothetical protein
MTVQSGVKANDAADENGEGIPSAGRSRLRLDTLDRVRRELVKVYRDARDGKRDVSDASKLGHLLVAIGRLIEGSDLERRLEALEQRAAR